MFFVITKYIYSINAFQRIIYLDYDRNFEKLCVYLFNLFCFNYPLKLVR